MSFNLTHPIPRGKQALQAIATSFTHISGASKDFVSEAQQHVLGLSYDSLHHADTLIKLQIEAAELVGYKGAFTTKLAELD